MELGRGLSVNQIRYLDRLLLKYSDQIENFEEVSKQLGLQAEPQGEDTESGPLLESMKLVKEWKPPVKRGRREWDDKKFYESLSRQFAQRKQLSPKQVSSLKKMIKRYAAQVAGYAELAEKFGIGAPAKAPAADESGAAAE